MNWLKNFIGPSIPEVDPQEAQQRQQAGALLVDVRETSEWRDGHAPGAKHIPLGQLAQKLPTLPLERDVLFICRSGNRSARATEMARAAGVTATNVAGGMMAWTQAGLPAQRS